MKALAITLCTLLVPAAYAARIMDPNLAGRMPERISAHVYEIEGFPDVEFVIGSQATLVVDTGLGPANGAVVAAAAKKLAKGAKLYLVTTHYHPEHASGDGGFPQDTIIVRSRIQQQELLDKMDGMVTRFRGQPQFASSLPEKIVARPPNILFDTTYTIDLGGVHARIDQVGPAHTQGDEIVWVPEDRTLMSGDIAIHDEPPRITVENVKPMDWIPLLDRLAALKPLHVVPDHAEPGDASLLSAQRELILNPPPAPSPAPK